MKFVLLSLLFFITTFAQDLQKVSLQLKWKYQFQFAGFIMAKEKGFYNDVGLDVDILEFDLSVNVIKDIEKGTIDFAVSDSALILAAMSGKPVVVMLSVLQNSPYSLMALKSSGIKSLKDINGKKLALYKNLNEMSINAMLMSNQIEYIKTPVVFSLDTLLSGENDMKTVYLSNEPFTAKEQGIEVVLFTPKDYGFDGYGDMLFTSKQMLQNRPELVEKMYESSKMGWEYAFSHIEETVDIIHKKYNTLNKSKKALVYEAEVLKSLSGYGENFGQLDKNKVKNIAQLFSFMKKGKRNFENLNGFIYEPKTSQLSPSELQWLEQKNTVRIRVANAAPYQINENGKFEGISVDYIEKILRKYNIKYKFISSANIGTWNQALSSVRDKKNLDLMLVVKKTPQRQKNMLFTDDYISSPWVIFTRDDSKFISGIKNLEGKKVAVENGYVMHKLLQTKYPKINLDIKKGLNPTIQALKSLAVGDVDAYVGNLTIGSYISKSLSLDNIKVAAPTPFGNHEHAMAVRDDWSPLVSIINKELRKMSVQDKDKIYNKYLSIKYEYGISFWDVIKWIAIITVIFLIIVLLISLSHRRLKKEIKKTKILKNELKQSENELKELNNSLAQKVEFEINKNKKHQLIMMEQIKLAQMGEMIANIAHQWRQPLSQVNSSILVIDAVLKKNGLQNELIDTKLLEIENLTQYMSNTIDNFQNFFNSDKRKTLFYLRETIDQSISIIQGTLSSNFTKIEINADELFESKGYPMELQQVLVVILSNANDVLKTREVKNPKIIIDVKCLTDTYVISISDNAGGVKIENLEQVFEPYYTTKHKSQGRGIGLYMAKMIIEEGMKGKLTLENKKNGACFKIKILKEINDK